MGRYITDEDTRVYKQVTRVMRCSKEAEGTDFERVCTVLRNEVSLTFCSDNYTSTNKKTGLEKSSGLDEVPLHKTEWRQCRCDHRNAHSSHVDIAWFRHD